MYSPGTKIIFIYTGEKGTITRIFPDGAYEVRLYSGDLIPAFPEDIVDEPNFSGIQKPVYTKPEKKSPNPASFFKKSSVELFFSREELEQLENKYESLNPDSHPEVINPDSTVIEKQQPSDSGLYLHLFRANDFLFVVYLVNDTPFGYRFKFSLKKGEAIQQSLKHEIPAYAYFPIGEISLDLLQESPSIHFQVDSIEFDREIKLKGKHLSRPLEKAPLCGLNGILMLLFDKPPKKKKEQPLPEIPSDHILKLNDKERIRVGVYQTERYAAFPKDIDLHLDKLVSDPYKIDPQKALAIQLAAFHDFLMEAIVLGIPQFYVIHGIGAGRLRQEVHNILRSHPDVVSFSNEYFEKYGHGATVVNL